MDTSEACTQDEECDSNFVLKRHKPVRTDENSYIKKHNFKNHHHHNPPKVTHVKPKTSYLDKIVHNLKNNLLKKQIQIDTTSHTSLKKHELFIKIVEKLEFTEYSDQDDDLTDLAWLTRFSLQKEMGPNFGNCLLSPPQSPKCSSFNQSLETHSGYSAKSFNKMSNKPLPIINPKFQTNFDLKYGDDEADGTARRAAGPPQRPPYSFSGLTFLAIESSRQKRLSVKEIYTWITQNFPYYQSVPSGSWKNSIRHNLSYNHCFAKVDKNLLAMRDFSGKGSLWCINPQFRPALIELIHKNDDKIAGIPFLQDVPETPTNSTPKVLPSLVSQTIINPKIISQLINRNSLIAAASPKNSSSNMSLMPRITTVNKLTSSKPLSKSSSHEMDAVNALLTMKSRSNSSNQAVSSNQEKKGRRKLLLRPPIKNVIITPSQGSIPFDAENSNDSLDLNSDDNSQSSPSYLNIKANDSDDNSNYGQGGEEEGMLKIDESDDCDDEEIEEGEKVSEQDVARRRALKRINNKALLELSRAAKHVELFKK